MQQRGVRRRELPRRRLLAGVSSFVAVGCGAPAIVHLVRHAEKLVLDQTHDAIPTMMRRDPPLSALGERRARSLAIAMSSVKLSACFATEYRRTRETLEPTARAQGLTVEIVSADDVEGLCHDILAHAGRRVLVAGHSNTVPEIAARLGVGETITLGDDDYGDLFTFEAAAWSTSLRKQRFDPPY